MQGWWKLNHTYNLIELCQPHVSCGFHQMWKASRKWKDLIRRKTYLSCVEMQVCEYLLSAAYLTERHFLPEISKRLTLLSNSVLLPANMGPIISSILPRCTMCSIFFWVLIWGTPLSFLLIGDSELMFFSELLLPGETLLLLKLLLD